MNKIKLAIARYKFYYHRHIKIHLTYTLLFLAIAVNAYSYTLWKNEWKYQSSYGDSIINRAVLVSPAEAAPVDEIPLIITIKKGTLADRNNNPGNLRFNNQIYATKGDGGFAKFETPEQGYKALLRQIRIDQNRDFTLTEFINKYAPPVENNTIKYIREVANKLKTNVNTNISDLNTNDLAKEIMFIESGSVIK